MSGGTYRVLGPVEVCRDGRPLPPLAPRLRTALAALLVDAGRTVPHDVFADRVWRGSGRDPLPATVQATISKLRLHVEPGASSGHWREIRTGPHGYRLDVATGAVDALRFPALLRSARELAQRGRTVAARAEVGEALALWRGPAYADVGAAFAAQEAARLESLRLDAAELAAELDLRLGRHDEVVDDLTTLVREAPLREGPLALLMTALYRAGRQAEALAVYADARARFADQLGVDLGPAVRSLHQRVLQQDAGLAVPAGADEPPDLPSAAVSGPPQASRLPAALTSFVGRADDLDRLAGAVLDHRLTTVVGPGGSGKTRLALETARRLSDPGPPAVLVELSGVEDPSLVTAEIATSLGVSLLGGDPLRAVGTALQDRPLLLLLDNCEHLVSSAARAAAALLERCPELRVLATSRQPLDVPGERVVTCGSLPTDGPGSDAVRLFVDRAGLVAPPLASAAEVAVVQRLCAELDGLPLAIELAAACLATLPLPELAERMVDRFAVLGSARPTVPAHQRSLAAAIQWSIDLLAPTTLSALHAVSTFSGGFAVDALAAVAATSDGPALEALRGLAAGSLVEVDHGQGRYRTLETLRQYVDLGIPEVERRRFRDRHAHFFLELAERIEPTLRHPEGAAGWRRLDAEQQNLRSALAHLRDTGQDGQLLRLAGALGWWWYRRGHVEEGRRWLAGALAAADGDLGPARGRALVADALLAYLAGDIDGIWARTEAVQRLPPGEDGGMLPLALALRAFVRALWGRSATDPEAARDADRSHAAAEGAGVDWVRAEIAMTLGQLARAAGDLPLALHHLQRAERLALDMGHAWAWQSVLWVRAKVHLDRGEAAPALAQLSTMIRAAVEADDHTGTLAGLLTAVGAMTAAQRPRTAATLLGAVRTHGRRVGYDPVRMDPTDGNRYIDATRAALPPGEYAAALDDGGRLDVAAACALLHEVARPDDDCLPGSGSTCR